MNHAFSVDTQASLARYQSLHQDWDHKVKVLAQQLIDAEVDVVLADVPYLPLTAAQVADLMAGKWYVNIHTAANKGGEIRGQLMPK